MTEKILVTGGAGYIGSHTAIKLIEAGYQIVIADDLSNASPRAIDAIAEITGTKPEFVEINLTDNAAVGQLFSEHTFAAVIHFAGFKAVGESVQLPLKYYRNNLDSTINLLQAMEAHGVKDFVFSSSATVYGVPSEIPLKETSNIGAVNPYGKTKEMIESICFDLASSDASWNISLLRYFNPVGAHPSGKIGEDPTGIPNNLVPFVMQVAVGRRDSVQIFGGDWDTSDGTGVRDYIHVEDLAEGHLKALEHLKPGCSAYNLGTGQGYSVLEVVAAASKASGVEIPHEIVARRSGDIATSLADPTLANAALDWKAEKNLLEMMQDSWRWQSSNPNGFS